MFSARTSRLDRRPEPEAGAVLVAVLVTVGAALAVAGGLHLAEREVESTYRCQGQALSRLGAPGPAADGCAEAPARSPDLIPAALSAPPARARRRRAAPAPAPEPSGAARNAEIARQTMDRLGTDEEGLLELLWSLSPAERRALERAYPDLRADIRGEHSGKAEQRALGALDGDRPGESDLLGTYHPSGVYADAASGLTLRAVAFLADLPLTRGFIQKQILQQGGVEAFRELDLDSYRPAARAPLPAPPSGAGVSAAELAALAAGAPDGAGGPATVAELHRAYLAGETTPVEVARALLSRVEDLDAEEPPLGAFAGRIDEDALLRAARESARRYAEGRPLGPLDGIPVPVKDQLDVAGYHTRVGTTVLGREPAATDAEVVRRLREAGALPIGRAAMHELGFGTTGINPHHGTARNPHDRSRVAGGSSGGSAAAVAAGLTPIAVGSDAGGSTRIPAALSGVVGLKPTQGRMSQRGNYPLAPTVQQAGPIGATARDVALMYGVMAGHDPRDPSSVDAPVRLDGFEDTDLTGLTIGVDRAWNQHADPDIVKATARAVERLEARGARVKEIEIRGLRAANLASMAFFAREIRESGAAAPELRSAYGADVRVNFALAEALTDDDYTQAQRVRAFAAEEMERVLGEVDLVLSPSTASVAPALPAGAETTGLADLHQLDQLARFTAVANVTGLPALTFPAGADDRGLPVGVQVIGRPFDEATLLRVAHAHEIERAR